MFGGIMLLKGEAQKRETSNRYGSVAYTAIPYYSGANRGPGEMEVWLNNK